MSMGTIVHLRTRPPELRLHSLWLCVAILCPRRQTIHFRCPSREFLDLPLSYLELCADAAIFADAVKIYRVALRSQTATS